VVEDKPAFDQYRFTNTSGSPRCITVDLDGTDCGSVESVTGAAYLGSFDPSNACANYLADSGTDSMWFTGPISYSFTVPAGATFGVVVQELNSEAGCSRYMLTVSGLGSSCPTATVTPTGPPATGTAPAATNTSVATGIATATITAATTTATSTVSATACAMSFSDVPSGSSFYSYVMCLACKGIISGYADSTFRPGNSITRGQLSKIVALSAAMTDPVEGQTFEDVPPGSTFYAYIERMAGREVVQGYPCGGPGEPCGPGNSPYFRPNSNTTRGQIAKIVVIAAGFPVTVGAQTFEDVPPAQPFYGWIEALASRGYIGGYPCGGPGEPCGPGNSPYFRPGNGATRGQLSKIVSQAFFPACSVTR
ncbi:MAG TPA: S-layer homology domain-containing protein, partial [Chloroflexia bacterium]|nr:S-layer homology domain-containing protein [Chloroflexia bacterium]